MEPNGTILFHLAAGSPTGNATVSVGSADFRRMGGAKTLTEKAEEAEKLAAEATQPWVRESLEKLAKDYRTMAALAAIRSGSPAPAGRPSKK